MSASPLPDAATERRGGHLTVAARHWKGEEAFMHPTDHLPDVHHDTELEMAEESKPAVQAEHGPGLAPMMDVE